MSNALPVNPQGEDYLSAFLLYQNLTLNTVSLSDVLGTGISVSTAPLLALNGFGGALFQGAVLIDTASVSANMPLLTLPSKYVPQRDTYFPVVVLRAGAYVANAVKVTASTGVVTLITSPTQNDIVRLDNVNILLTSYN